MSIEICVVLIGAIEKNISANIFTSDGTAIGTIIYTHIAKLIKDPLSFELPSLHDRVLLRETDGKDLGEE